jgi:hypothetical protein
MPIPQREFGFAPDAFNLMQETGTATASRENGAD